MKPILLENKRPKISVTENNKEYVIPTLEKLGGKLGAIEHKAFLLNEMVFFIDGWENIDGCNKSKFELLYRLENFYEVDPKDYVIIDKNNTHKNKYTGILDMKGVPINNGDEVLVHDHNSFSKKPYRCKVVYKHGWKLDSIAENRETNGQGFDVYCWRKSIEVVGTGNISVFLTESYDELKEDWFHRNVNWTITGEQRILLHKCFKEAYELGQEQLYNNLN
jgi:hypothetical protein